MSDLRILTLMVPEQTRDDVIDALMAVDFISGFNLQEIAGFSREHSQYDIAEQVAGYRKLYRFEVLHSAQQTEALLLELTGACAIQDARYWVTPALQTGHFHKA